MEDLFNDFISFEFQHLINHEEFKTNRIHENLQEIGNISYNKDESNIIGFTNSVITVPGVTTKNIPEFIDYNKTSDLHSNLYRLYESEDIWAGKNCLDKGDNGIS